MRGTSATTGKAIDGDEHLKQSIRDILLTPIGSRIERREYGSRCMALLDAPLNAQTRIDLIASAAEALLRWEPRIVVRQILIDSITPGHAELTIFAVRAQDGTPVQLDGVTL